MPSPRFFLRTALLIFLSSLTAVCVGFLFVTAAGHTENFSKVRTILSQELGPFFLHNLYPTSLSSNALKNEFKTQSETFQIDYTIDPALQSYGQGLLDRYKPDYGAVTVVDAQTGKILALANTQKKNPGNLNLNLLSMFPAASVFKIVTAAAAVDRYQMSPETMISFTGANWTLRKRDVLTNVQSRWTRHMSIREAFANSINTVFGKLSLEKMKPKDLADYASRFGFNRDFTSEIPFDPSIFEMPSEDRFQLAQLASGYNRTTKMSPLHGALISAAIANDGKLLFPYLVDQVKTAEGGEVLYQGKPREMNEVMNSKTAAQLREMMTATVLHGTSRKSFRTLASQIFAGKIEIGGKTGSFSCLDPRGQVDWFVGYGLGDDGRKLAVSAITVNLEKWTVKSSFLAQSIVKSYFDLHPTALARGRRHARHDMSRRKVAAVL